MSRPRAKFPWDAIDAMAALGASEKYMAEYLLKQDGYETHEINAKLIARKTQLIRRRIMERWGVNFVSFLESRKEHWKLKLIQLQRKKAEEGNVSMLIWLGKQELGQSEKVDERIDHTSQGEKLEGPVILIPSNGTEQQN